MFAKRIRNILAYIGDLVRDHKLTLVILCSLCLLSVALGVVWAIGTVEYLSEDILTNYFRLVVYSGEGVFTFIGEYILLLILAFSVVTVIPYGRVALVIQGALLSYVTLRLVRDGIYGIMVFGTDGCISFVLYHLVTLIIVWISLIISIIIRHDGGYTCGGLFNRYTVEGAYVCVIFTVIWIVYVAMITLILKIVL